MMSIVFFKDERSTMKECIDIKTLVKRVLDFLGLEMHLLSNAKQVMLFGIESDDVVTCVFEADNGDLIEMPVEHTVNIDSSDLAARIFIDRLGSIKLLSYGMNIETLQPKKTVENPFFGMRSLEEIAMKLDLLGA